MKILCNVDQVECVRQGVDAPSSTVKIEVDPNSLTEEQRSFLADELYDGLRFPKDATLYICPPTYEGFLVAIECGRMKATRPEGKPVLGFTGGASGWVNQEELDEFDNELKELRRRLIRAAIEKDESKWRFRGTPEDLKKISDMARASLKKAVRIPPESVPPAFRRSKNSRNEGT